ncbi:MAG: tetratricopeptide repeat protein [Acidobacteriota bacterium]
MGQRRFSFPLAIVLTVSLCTTVVSRADSPTTWRAEALEHLQEGRWPEAAEALRKLAADEAAGAQDWAYLGLAERRLERPTEARQAYERAIALEAGNVTALAGLAIVLAASGQGSEALKQLEKAAVAGLPPAQLRQSPAFAELRSLEGFEAVLAVADRAANPCRHRVEYSQFDFWVGTWDVMIAGQKQAENRITKEMNGCLVRERYRDSTGYEGESLNYFDPESGAWKQNWVDRGGGVTRYQGSLEAPGVMRMTGANTPPGGETELARVTWTRRDDGTVHHFIERSRDGGATWRVMFDAIYVRATEEPAAP